MPRLSYLIALLLLAACAVTGADSQLIPTATPIPLPQTTPVPTVDRQLRQVPTPSPAPTSSALPAQCQGTAELPGTRHTVLAELDYANRQLVVRQMVDYINRTTVGLSQIIFNIKANAWPGILSLDEVTVDGGKPASTSLVGQRLVVNLEAALKPGCAVKVELWFGLRLPVINLASPEAYRGYLGYSPRQLNLGHWLATVAPRLADDWVSREDTPIGEQDVLDEADWDVTLTVSNAPDGLRVAAPGVVRENGPAHWHFVLNRARDFSLSLSDAFVMTSARSANGVKVELYTFAEARIQTESGILDSAAFALDSAVKATETFSDLYGAYPYDRLVIVQGDFPDGMEFSGIVFVGGEYFRAFNGPTSYLMIITVHEISHQWWYSKVGNDQAMSPWLDEALATYSEYVFIEEYYPALKDWWWDFRVNRLAPEGYVDSTVYEFSSRRAYINAVYLRGTQMLHDLRSDLGTEAFFDWLRRYGDAGAGRLMAPEQFWSLLTPEQLAATRATRERYLRQPDFTVLQMGGS
ncbi:MAG: M1 family metallopeptidase [Chloroflexi bacterium]|nr:M1 family metallopeptidase [Chloroflexota bacterium]